MVKGFMRNSYYTSSTTKLDKSVQNTFVFNAEIMWRACFSWLTPPVKWKVRAQFWHSTRAQNFHRNAEEKKVFVYKMKIRPKDSHIQIYYLVHSFGTKNQNSKLLHLIVSICTEICALIFVVVVSSIWLQSLWFMCYEIPFPAFYQFQLF